MALSQHRYPSLLLPPVTNNYVKKKIFTVPTISECRKYSSCRTNSFVIYYEKVLFIEGTNFGTVLVPNKNREVNTVIILGQHYNSSDGKDAKIALWFSLRFDRSFETIAFL
jgi:hypothetical protein